ncbi:695826a5-0d88-4427-af0a-047b1606cc71-CDS [Sclerotinia trifoliorum]|uniref:695826a5-0d88-4427-af0a-047b1606cc71-CDS n=1 Tax=Sclerotinia trifoliorum TaxID=28548 RepID=A0A8H2VND6_9HELO|nr:695826a5-0d88-4427-af0a-047b1606cc71-CDS [Sclerotinia trifoliorum]
MGNIISGSYYELAINESDANHTISPVFSTTKESRWVALGHFRIRLPLAGDSHIRVSPDDDVVYLTAGYDICDINLLAAIFHDIRAYDPKDQGLMHVAIQGNYLFPDEQPFTGSVGSYGMRNNDGSMSHGSSGKLVLSHPTAQASLIDILSTKLRTLWCVQRIYSKTRVYGPTIFERPVTMVQWMETLPMLPPMITLGISYLDFEWLENDPRPIKPDTSRMPFIKDPRRYYHSWKVIEEALGVRHVVPFRVYVCVSSEIAPVESMGHVRHTEERLRLHQVIESNRQTENEHFKAAVDYWAKLFGHPQPPRNERFDESRFREEHVKVDRDDMTAIGMWVFPEEAFGQVDNDNFAKVYYHSYKTTSKSSVTPGLVLFNLASLPQ